MDQRDIKADAMRLGMQAALMRELVQTPMWKCYDEFEYRKGVVMGLRDALRIPENIVEWSERANRN